jgi:hypothetical protein
MAGRDVEAKHSSRRFTQSMKLCKLGAELDRIWHVVDHVDKVAQEKVRLRRFQLEFAPSQRLRNESRGSLVKSAHGIELSLHHHAARVFRRNLEEELLLYSAR